METDLWGIPSKHPKLSKISCFSTHTVRPPSLVIPGFVLNGPWGISPYLPSWKLGGLILSRTTSTPSRSGRPWGPLKIDGKMLGHLPWDVGCFCIHLGSYNHLISFAHGRTVHFLQISQVPKWDLIGSHISFSLFDSTNMSMAKFLFANSYRLPTKMQVTDLSGQPLF